METFLKKLEHRFLVESTEIESASFPYKKSAISEAVKTNRMVTTKWSFASNYFIFLKFLFQFKNLLNKDLIWCTNNPNTHIRTFCKRWRFYLTVPFPCENKQLLRNLIMVC